MHVCVGVRALQVYGVEWNPHEDSKTVPPAFLSFGRKHIKMWMQDGATGGWSAKAMSFGARHEHCAGGSGDGWRASLRC